MRWIAALCFVGLLLAQGQGRTIPPSGDDTHPGSPAWCQAAKAGGYEANCGLCKTMCDEGHRGQEDKKCKSYCRPGSCKCHPQCETHLKTDSPVKAGM